MKIFTSYFGNIKKLKADDILPIGVSQYPPRFFNGISLKVLAPYPYMLAKDYPPEEYTRVYFEKILGRLKPKEIVSVLESYCKTYDKTKVALCCFEKQQNECHREYIAQWLNKAGYMVKEYGVEEVDNSKDAGSQMELF